MAHLGQLVDRLAAFVALREQAELAQLQLGYVDGILGHLFDHFEGRQCLLRLRVGLLRIGEAEDSLLNVGLLDRRRWLVLEAGLVPGTTAISTTGLAPGVYLAAFGTGSVTTRIVVR